MSVGRKITLCSCALIGFIAAPSYGSDVLFSENFESYNITGDNNPGLPLLSEGASGLWYGGRFGTPDGGTIDDDISVWRLPDVYPDNVTFGQVEDDAGMIFHISTLGYENVSLSFEWKTHLAESSDLFTAGYYVGDIDFVNDTFDGANNDLVHRFNEDGPAWSSWTQLMAGSNNANWTVENFLLPDNTADVWVAFWMNNGEGDLGKVDNIVVAATPVPTPGGLALLGLAGLRRRRRRF